MSLSALSPETQALTRRVTALSVAVAAVLIIVKTLAWLASGSVAMLASLSDSGLDLIASLITFFAVRYAAEPPDAEHRFGHGKAEAFSSLMQGGLVFASGALIGQEAIRAMLNPRPVEQGLIAMAVMGVSIGPDPGPDHRPVEGAEIDRLNRRFRRPGPLCRRPGLQRRGPDRDRRGLVAGSLLD